jgi:hypothetical protein
MQTYSFRGKKASNSLKIISLRENLPGWFMFIVVVGGICKKRQSKNKFGSNGLNAIALNYSQVSGDLFKNSTARGMLIFQSLITKVVPVASL